jgi:hypothetical protein
VKNLFWPILTVLVILTCSATAFDQVNISFQPQPGTPYLIGRPEFNIDTEEFTTLSLKIRSPQGGTARLFWATNFDPQLNEQKSFNFDLAAANTPKEYVFNLRAQNSYWAGYVSQLLLLADNGAAGIEITEARAIPGNFWTGLKSSWREFMTFERPLPRTINVIFGPKINGQSVNLYIYWSIFILSVLYLFYLIAGKRASSAAIIKELTAKVFLLCLIFWVLLDARMLVDQFRYAALNRQIFGGKTLAEKQALSTFQTYHDFYYYLQRCRAKLPDRATYRLIVPEGYVYFREKAWYYLYPLIAADSPGEVPDYLLVYDPQKLLKAKDIPAGYYPLAAGQDGGYIMKRSGR